MSRSILALAFALSAAGCFGDDLDRCIDDRTTIASGVYGQLTTGCDTPDCESGYAVGTEVRIYDQDPGPYEPEGVTPLAATTSDELGFYQLELAPGTYYACTFVCNEVSVTGGAPIRWDWTSGPGGGNWYAAEACM